MLRHVVQGRCGRALTGPLGGQHHQTAAGHPGCQVVDRLQGGLARVLQILDDQEDRSPVGQMAESRSHRLHTATQLHLGDGVFALRRRTHRGAHGLRQFRDQLGDPTEVVAEQRDQIVRVTGFEQPAQGRKERLSRTV